MTYNVFGGTLNPTHFTSLHRFWYISKTLPLPKYYHSSGQLSLLSSAGWKM